MTACWQWLQRGPLAGLKHRPWLFVDLVDPSGRGRDEVVAMLESLRGFQATCRAVLGVNLTELEAVSRFLGMQPCGTVASAVAARAAALRERLGVEQVVVHNALATAVAEIGGEVVVQAPGPHCASPRKTTGAGDRFNAGYCLGLLLGLPARQRLALGSATGGFFVREARSATLDEVAAFVDAWAGGRVAEARA
jgi:sugar/nucleoside kinase (ribokinase family)